MEFDLETPIANSHDSTLASLLLAESDHTPLVTSLHLSPLRAQTVSLILQFCSKFDPFLSFLSINYLDRFLSTHPILEEKPWILRLLAVSCISLAMKMREEELSVAQIEHDGGLVFDYTTIQRMEMLILGALKWRMRSITAFAFISFFISLFKFKDPPSTQALKARAIEIIISSQKDMKIIEFKPSIVSASALLSASHELFPLQFPFYKTAILNCTFLNKEKFSSCYNLVQEIAMEDYKSVLEIMSSSRTPINVLDLPLSWISSSTSSSDYNQEIGQNCKDESTPNSSKVANIATLSVEKHLKRRKIGGFFQKETMYISFHRVCSAKLS